MPRTLDKGLKKLAKELTSDIAPKRRYVWSGMYLRYNGVNIAQVLYDDGTLGAARTLETDKPVFKVIAFNEAHGIVSAIGFESVETAQTFAKAWCVDGPEEATKPHWLSEADRKNKHIEMPEAARRALTTQFPDSDDEEEDRK